MAEIFKFNEGIGKMECTQEGVAEAIQQLGVKNSNLETALQNCNDEIQKRNNRINPSAMSDSMKRNIEMFGKTFLKLPDSIKLTLPSIQPIQQTHNTLATLQPSGAKLPETHLKNSQNNPLSVGSIEKNQGGITYAYSALKNRDAQIKKALGE